jgi:tryptophanyl-tRNA synthetase
MGRVFSGIQPSGELHIGNYLGAIRNWVNVQEEHDCIFCVVDYHAITVEYDTKQMPPRVLDLAAVCSLVAWTRKKPRFSCSPTSRSTPSSPGSSTP